MSTIHLKKLLFTALLCLTGIGCSPTKPTPYEAPAEEVTGTAANGEAILNEDGGP